MSDHGQRNLTGVTKDQLDTVTIGGARLHGGPIQLVEYDPRWPELFEREAARIALALAGAAIHIEHVGSTAVPGLAAKPIIDILLVVADSSDEPAYLGLLESKGYELRIREPAWWEHRMLKGPDTDINLHVFSMGCPEIDRMVRFRNQLRANPIDRDIYCTKKRELASSSWDFVQSYADAKTEVIEEIVARANP